jgi:hypothetical protein
VFAGLWRGAGDSGVARNTTTQLATVEDVALATADTSSDQQIYTSSPGNNTLVKPVVFHIGPTRIQVKPGGSANTIYAVIRKVPQGYSAPGITVTTGNTTFADMQNVLAYGVVRVEAASSDPMNRIDLRILRRSVSLARGDSVYLQVVPNISSSGQTYSSLIEYSTT